MPTPGSENYSHKSQRKAPDCKRRSGPKGMTDTPPLTLLGRLSCRRRVAWTLSTSLVQDDPNKGQTLISGAATTRVSSIVLRNALRCVTLSRSSSQSGALSCFAQRSPPQREGSRPFGPRGGRRGRPKGARGRARMVPKGNRTMEPKAEATGGIAQQDPNMAAGSVK